MIVDCRESMGIQRIDYLGASVELWKGGFIDMEMKAMNAEDIFLQ